MNPPHPSRQTHLGPDAPRLHIPLAGDAHRSDAGAVAKVSAAVEAAKRRRDRDWGRYLWAFASARCSLPIPR